MKQLPYPRGSYSSSTTCLTPNNGSTCPVSEEGVYYLMYGKTPVHPFTRRGNLLQTRCRSLRRISTRTWGPTYLQNSNSVTVTYSWSHERSPHHAATLYASLSHFTNIRCGCKAKWPLPDRHALHNVVFSPANHIGEPD